MVAAALTDELADHLQVVYGAAVALVIVVLLTPAVGGMARLLGVVDRPDGRRLNRRIVPRLGGLALFFGIFVPALAFLDLSGETRGLLLGAAVAACAGGRSSAARLRRPRSRSASGSGSIASRSRSSGSTRCPTGSGCRCPCSGSSRS